MPYRQKVRALVLSRRNVGEADRLVTFFSRDYGIVKAVAKGVRKIPSQRGGHLEPYTQVLALLSQSNSGSYVGAVETERRFASLVNDKDALHHARNISYVVMHLFDEFDPQKQLYDGMVHAWRVLSDASFAKRNVIESAMIVMSLQCAGLMPDLQSCIVCGSDKPSESVVLDAADGGWKCLLCHADLKSAQYSLSPKLLATVRFMVRQPERAMSIIASDGDSSQLLLTLRMFVASAVEHPMKWYTMEV